MAELPSIAVLPLPNVVPFDLVLAGRIFGYRTPGTVPAYYRLLLCGSSAGLVTMAGGFREQPVPATRDSMLQRVQAWALERLGEPLTVDDLARRANTSARHLTPRFNAEIGTTPLKWLQWERVRLAQRLLEQMDVSVQRIAERAGFGPAIALRRQFADAVGTTPGKYRGTFRGRDGSGSGRVAHQTRSPASRSLF